MTFEKLFLIYLNIKKKNISNYSVSFKNNLPQIKDHLGYLVLNAVVSILCLMKMTFLVLSVFMGLKTVPDCLSYELTVSLQTAGKK